MKNEFEIEKYLEMELIVNHEFDQITVADPQGKIIRIYRDCESVFGISEKDMLGKSGEELEKLGVLSKSVTKQVVNEKRRIAFTQDTASGKRLMVTGIPMFDSNGKIVKIVNISRDITEIENLNNKLAETEEMLSWFRNEMQKKQVAESNYIVSNNKEMENIYNLASQIADTSASILIMGETGVGKGFLAKTLHQLSRKRNSPFVQVSCSAIPENLLESVLFGYEKGAFTGASQKGKKGLFEVANDGTVFLDEIGDLSLSIQAKLLSVLQEKMFYKVGGTENIALKARIITATNKDLIKLINEGKFREDLYYRLNVVPITIPPLRERPEDIALLAKFFIGKFNNKYGYNRELTQDGYDILANYEWLGNVRELENLIERLVITSTSQIITADQILKLLNPKNYSNISINSLIPIKDAVEEVEKKLLVKARQQQRTTRKMAGALGISQAAVVKKMQKYNL